MRKFFLIPLLLLIASPSLAQRSEPFVYSKTLVKIVPKSTEPGPSQAGAPDITKMLPTLKRVPKEFTVDVRPAEFLKQRDFISMQPFSDRGGLFILFDPPAEAQVTQTKMISIADVLFIDADGNITKIAPSLKLSSLTETIDSGGPIRALLFLKAGTTVSSDIGVGDKIENEHFKSHPIILQ